MKSSCDQNSLWLWALVVSKWNKWIASRSWHVLNGLQRLDDLPISSWPLICPQFPRCKTLSCYVAIFWFSIPWTSFSPCYKVAFVRPSCVQSSELWKVLQVSCYRGARKWNGTKRNYAKGDHKAHLFGYVKYEIILLLGQERVTQVFIWPPSYSCCT